MQHYVKFWFIGVILFSLLMGISQSVTYAATKVLGYEFTNGLVLFKQNGKYGMLNKKGKVAYKTAI